MKFEDTISFFHKLLVDKAKKDAVVRREASGGEPMSLDEFTNLHILSEIGTVKFASETLIHHLSNLKKNLKNPLVKFICRLYGLHG